MHRGGISVESGHAVRILIVDDSKAYRDQLASLLRTQAEFDIVGMASDGEEAVVKAEQLQPDVVLMDQQMPKLTGIEATRHIKSILPSTRVLFIAAEGRWHNDAMRAGAERFFLKDEDLSDLLRTIRDPLSSLRPIAEAPRRDLLRDVLGNAWIWRAVGLIGFALILFAFMRSPRIMLVRTALFFGLFFFAYGLKYYSSIALILFATSGNGNGNRNGNRYIARKINGWINGGRDGKGKSGWPGGGLNGLGKANGGNGRLPAHQQPFISIHLPLYNEVKVVDRLLTACTSMDYENYEVIVADDSTDETTQILRERWAPHPRVKLSHREDRSGFKGGALKVATERIDPRTEFIAIFDADFVPPPDILHQFLAYFYGVNDDYASSKHGDQKPKLLDEKVAVVQGYQWHILNASENWITRGVRSEYSGSYVIERSGQELVGSMKMISGSVFMIRADVLREVGWRTSITEDWELTIRLHLHGYKVLYTPFIQAPAECVAKFRQLARQRMRWAEGHTFNVKKYFSQVMTSPRINRREKAEFLYYAPYYLQAVFFIIGTIAWLISQLFFNRGLPFWTETLGWSLVFVNALSLLLMNLTGLFLERGVRRNIGGLLSFVILTYLLVPYQAYAALKGLFEPHEGGWHRTQKTGVITEVLERLGMRRKLPRLRPKRKGRAPGLAFRLGFSTEQLSRFLPPFFRRLTNRMRLRHGVAFGLMVSVLLLLYLSARILVASAAPDILYLRATNGNGGTPVGQDMDFMQGVSEDTLIFDSVDDEAYWYTAESYPTVGEEATLLAGDYKLNMHFNQLPDAWWDTDYLYREQIKVSANGIAVDAGYSISFTFDHKALVDISKSLASGDDVRLVHWNGSSWAELDRALDPLSSWNDASPALIWFKLVDPIASSVSDNNYYLYYGKASASNPPDDWANGFLTGDDFSGGTISSEFAGSEEHAPFVKINVSIYRTQADGSLPQAVVSASDIKIDANSADSLEVSIGRGLEQTFTSADPQRIRIHIGVTQVNGGGSFTLAYDSAASPSSLDTPALTVTDIALMLLGVVVLIPIITTLLTSNRRLAVRVTVVAISMILALALLAQQVIFVNAAPDKFYLRDTTNNGASPAGLDMNNAQGSSEDTLVFDDVSDDTFWYTEVAYPSGGEDAGLAAGGYTLDMHFSQLPTFPSNWYGTEWPYRKKITIDAGMVPADLYNFPVLISLPADSAFADKTQPDGGDIVFTVSNGINEMDHEIEKYETSTGELTAWVKVPTLSSSTDTVLYMYYGNPDIGNQWNVIDTWDENGNENYVAVWHLDEDQEGTGASELYKDSTFYGNDGDDYVAATGQGGQIDGGQEFNGSSDYIDTKDGPLDLIEQLTISGWVYRESNTSTHHVASKAASDACPWQFEMLSSTNVLRLFTREATDTSESIDSTDTVGLNGWHHVAVVRNDTQVTFYIDGSPDSGGWQSFAVTPTANSVTAKIGAAGELGGNFFDGFLDELRISDIARPSAWISTEYNNQKNQGVGAGKFIKSLDSEEAMPAVDIVVSVYHTDASGGDEMEIVTSSTITITSDTPNIYPLNIGTGSAQTFQAADPRRVRVHIDATEVRGSGSFTLAYDSAANPSALNTPAMVIVDLTFLFAAVVIFIPILIDLLMKKRRLVARIAMYGLAFLIVLGILSQQVFLVSAAPDTLYLRDTTVNGASPAGEDMNLVQGTTEDTLLFDDALDEGYWYTDLTYPTGGEDAVLAAGSYELNMHFDQLPQLPADWYSANWDYRKKITLDAALVTADQSNFPVLISIPSDGDLAASALDNGDDLLFTASDGLTKLSHEIEDFDGATGELQTWVKLGTFSSSLDTEIYLYYGYPGASNQENVSDVWSNGFLEVWHLDEISGNHIDSTSTNYVGTPSGSVTQNAAGQIDGGDEFVGPSTTTYLTLADGDLGNNAPFSISAWFQVDTSTAWTGIVTKGRETGNDWVGLWANGTQYLFGWDWQGGKGGNVNGSVLTEDTWYYGTATFDGSDRRLYLNDQLDAGPSSGFYSGLTNSDTSVGNDRVDANANSFDGFIDEVRISSAVRSLSWIATEYNNQANQGVGVGKFIKSLSSEEEAPRVQIVVSVYHTQTGGGDPQEIITSSVTDIRANTSDPYPLDIGAGAAQTFQSSDPRRLRVHIDVSQIYDGGSFTLAYDSAANPSSLNIPSMVVTDVTFLLVALVILIPIVMNLFMKRRRLALRIASFVISLMAVIAILGQQVLLTSAAPDVFYLHDTAAGGTWYDTDWSYRKKITIYASEVTADESSFPVLIKQSSDAQLAASAQTDGGDILFTSADGTTKLDHEIEKFIPGDGELVAWVEVPSLSGSVDTILYMYYGNATVADQWNINGTWDTNYKGVWHLKEDPGPGGSGDITDSTSNNKHGTAEASMLAEDLVPGQIGDGIDFDGGDDYLWMPDPLDGSNITISAWIKAADLSNSWHTIAQRDDVDGEWWYDWQLYARANDAPTPNHAVFRVDVDDNEDANEEAESDILLTTTPWYYLVGTYDGTDLKFYRDGQVRDTDNQPGTIPDSDKDLWIAMNNEWGEPFQGIIDEVRVSNTPRTASWIETSYKNQYNPAAFYDLDSQETPGISPAGKYMNLTQGTGGSTLLFDSTDDEAYWYTELTYPTGGEDATLAAGNYTLNMYFDQLPGIKVDDASTNTTTGGSSVTIPHTASGSNRLMLVGVSINPDLDEYVTGITWNTTETLTKIRSDVTSDDARTEIWYLVNPTATSANVVVTFNVSLQQSAIASVVTFSGVDQTTPLGDDNGFAWATEQYPSISVITNVGDMVFGVVAVEDKSITATDADTEHWRENLVGGNTTGGGGTKAGEVSSSLIGWDFDGADHAAISAVVIKPEASVDIAISVYHTDASGGDPQAIVTSSTITIDEDTPNPYELPIGSGSEKTFTSADPRHLRMHINVTAVNGGGSFTLAYDSVTDPSSLDTPSMVVPDATTLLVVVVIFIPLVMSLFMRKRRLALRLASVGLSLVIALTILSQQIIPVTAAPDVFYLHDSDTQSGTINVQVGASTDDAEESLGDGGMDLTSSDLELIREGASNNQEVGLRFLGITVPQGAKITNAYIEFEADEADTETTNLLFWGQDSDDTTTFTSTDNDITDRPKTTASAAWNDAPEWVIDTRYQTPDLSAVIQEIVDRTGWTSGNSMVVIVNGSGQRVADSYDKSGAYPALLHIDYSVVDPDGKVMNITPGSAGSTMLFDELTDEAYWYTELTYPTGGDDGTIVAGDYNLKMYFDQLPGNWWDTEYLYRHQIEVTTTTAAVDAGYSVPITFNHANLVTNSKSLATGADVRLVHWNGSAWTELDRTLDPLSSWNNVSTQIWFALVDPIAVSSTDNNYYIYYGNAAASSPPEAWANVFMVGDDFDDGSLTSDLAVSTAGTANISETSGEAFIDLGTEETTDAGVIVGKSQLPSDNQFAIMHKTKLVSGGGISNPEVKNIGIQESVGQATVDTSANENPRRRIIDFTRVSTQAQVYYFDSPGSANYWDGAAWQTGNGFWGNLSLDTYYIHELISDGTDWYVRISDAGGTEIEVTTPILWSNTYDTGNPFWFYWGEIYTDFYYGDQKSDWVYVRDYVDPEPSAALTGLETDAPYVRIVVSVYHTPSNGSDPTEIVTSSTYKIDSTTSNPYELPIGSGAEQTFTAADPQRLRAHVDVTAVNGGGSFTLAYDSAADHSSLDTPIVVVPEWGIAYLLIALLIPYLTVLVWRRKRLAMGLILLMAVFVSQIAVNATDVEAFLDEPEGNRFQPYTTPLMGDAPPDPPGYGPKDGDGFREKLDLRTSNSKTKHLFEAGEPTDTFVWEGSMAPLHYQDAQGNWNEIRTDLPPSSRSINGFGDPAWEMTENDYEIFVRGEFKDGKPLVRFKPKRSGYWVQFAPQELQWTAMNGQSEVIAPLSSVQPVVAGDEIVWAGAYGVGVDLRLEVGAGRMHKWLDLEGPLSAPSDSIMEGGYPILEYVESISYNPGLSIWVNGQEWDEEGVVITTGEIQFREPQGEVAFTFPLPSVTEAGGKGVVGQYRLMSQGNSLSLAVGVPLAWLRDAVYPISIDPTVNVQVGTGTDDCDRWGATDFHCEYAGVYLDYTDINQSDGMRFTNVAIPNGATIDTAYLTLRARNSPGAITGGTTIKGQDHNDPPTFTQGDYAEYDARVRTTASVYWQPSAWVLDTDYNSPEIKTIVQEIVDRSGWSSGNAMVMVFEADQVQDIQGYAYDGSATYAPKLYIEYSPSKSFAYKVGASSDDCDRDNVNWSTTTTTFYLDWDSVGQADGVRFTNVIVPKGATIVSANLRVRARDGASPVTGGTTIYGQAADDPPTFSTAADWNLRTWTTAYVHWQPSAWAANTYYDSPDISAVVQEIVDRPGWAAGNAMAFKLDGDEVQHIYGYSYDYGTGQYAPELEIEYSMYDSLSVQVSASSDDCDHDSVTWDTTTTYFYLDWDNPARTDQSDGLRFASVAVPDGATIVQAYFTVRARDTQTSGIGGATIYGQDADDPLTFSTRADYEARTWISSPSVHWGPSTWVAEVEYDSPDVSSVVQAIIDRPGWASGQAMAFLFDGDEDDNVDGYSWDYNSGQYAPQLYIEYTIPPSAPSNCQATFVSDTQIDVTWSDNSYNETGFKIESSVDGGGFSQIDMAGEDEESYSDISISADHSYQYQVRATNIAGDSAYCTATSTIYTSPDPPTNVTATHTANLEITLTWTDQSQYEDQFRIERDKNGGGYVFLANDTDGSPFVDNTITQEEYDNKDTFTYRIRSEISSQSRLSVWVYSNAIVVPERALWLVLLAPALPIVMRRRRRGSKVKKKVNERVTRDHHLMSMIGRPMSYLVRLLGRPAGSRDVR